MTFPAATANVGVHFYAADKTTKTESYAGANFPEAYSFNATYDGTNVASIILPADNEGIKNAAYVRVVANEITADSIITVNEVIA